MTAPFLDTSSASLQPVSLRSGSRRFFRTSHDGLHHMLNQENVTPRSFRIWKISLIASCISVSFSPEKVSSRRRTQACSPGRVPIQTLLSAARESAQGVLLFIESTNFRSSTALPLPLAMLRYFPAIENGCGYVVENIQAEKRPTI